MSVVIGIHDGHNASAALVRDGRVEIALQEERFTRVKNQGDAPASVLAAVLAAAERDATRARVALNGNYMKYGQWRRERIADDYSRCSNLASRLKQPLKGSVVDRFYQAKCAGAREYELGRLGLAAGRLTFVEHHLAHASAAYYTRPWSREEPADAQTLVLTCDGSGDRLSATVSIGQRNELLRIAEVEEHDSIGRLYALVTRQLGMAPLEHEYKVMGLAPYAQDNAEIERLAGMFGQIFEFTGSGLAWKRRRGVPSLYAATDFIARITRSERFDLIAAGVQQFLERFLVQWARNAIRQTGIRRLACAGGVFMNVKANLALLEMPEVDDVYVFPSCGDESNSIGAACRLAALAGDQMKPLGSIYYGDPISDAAAEKAFKPGLDAGKLRVRHAHDIETLTARTLAAGKIVARARGPLEFGARALGNRSILARADSPDAVRVINRIVKNRDFWMPFAPSVLAERADEYYIKPKPVASPYMMFAFRSRPEKRRAISAAQHPYDFTTRPHEVTAVDNPDYYHLLKEYEALTGEGVFLNTSFNLHGEPIVSSAADAVDVFLRSGLEYMALANWWVEKA